MLYSDNKRVVIYMMINNHEIRCPHKVNFLLIKEKKLKSDNITFNLYS